jgi:hypothetical protein
MPEDIYSNVEVENAFFNYDNPEGHELPDGVWEKRRDEWRKFKDYLDSHRIEAQSLSEVSR